MIDRRQFIAGIALLHVSSLLAATSAQAATKLTWENLVPPAPPIENLAETMPIDVQEAMNAMDYWRSFPAGAISSDMESLREDAKLDVEQIRGKLVAQGIDIDKEYARYLAWVEELDRRGRLTSGQYNGQEVSITGYLLPLDMDAKGSREFLLVPYVGACIHVPPPPPNQVVLVRTATPHPLDGLFQEATVTGRLKIEPARKDLSLLDGANAVDSGYVLETQAIVSP